MGGVVCSSRSGRMSSAAARQTWLRMSSICWCQWGAVRTLREGIGGHTRIEHAAKTEFERCHEGRHRVGLGAVQKLQNKKNRREQRSNARFTWEVDPLNMAPASRSQRVWQQGKKLQLVA